MRILVDPPVAPQARGPALVLLSGTFSEPEDFEREGFVAAARARGVTGEVVRAGSPGAEVADGSIASAIEARIAAGRSALWLAGISVGALAAMAYAWRHPDRVAGLTLLSPYPGSREWQREMARGGGPGSLPATPIEPPDAERDAWAWLAWRGREESPPTHIVYGSGDRFRDGQAKMAECVPGERAMRIEGAHDWATWKRAWDGFLDRAGGALR